MYKVKTVRQVQRNTARTLFDKGLTIRVLPSMMEKINVWQDGCIVQRNFDEFTSNFRARNCDDYHGKHVLYFVED